MDDIIVDNLKQLDYDPDETKKTWHFYDEHGDATMVVSIDYKRRTHRH